MFKSLVPIMKSTCILDILTPLETDLGVKVCSNVLAYKFAFDVNNGKTVSHKLFPYEKTDFYGKFLK